MQKFPDTLNGNNWSVFLFNCPKNKVEGILLSLFDCSEQIIPNGLPNYTIRDWSQGFITISLRILRDGSKKKLVEKLEKNIMEILKKENVKTIVNPTGKDQELSGWSIGATLDKCKAYNELSTFVVRLIERKQFNINDRDEMRHLAINMLFLREATKIPEPFAYFIDLISQQLIRQLFPIDVTSGKLIVPTVMKKEKKE